MEIFISVKKTSKAVKRLTPINRWGGGVKQATLGLWGTNGPEFPLDPPVIISNISLASALCSYLKQERPKINIF